jgi:hypothetical protein
VLALKFKNIKDESKIPKTTRKEDKSPTMKKESGLNQTFQK